MYDSIEQKGKIFTNVVTKEPVNVILQTAANIIKGQVHVRINQRLKDELDGEELFLAITDVTVSDLNGKILYQSHFIAVNRSHIIWLIPQKEIVNMTDKQ